MVSTQIEWLKSDLAQIEAFVKQLNQEGRSDLSKKVETKRDYLVKYLNEVST